MTTKKEEAKQKDILSKGARALIGMAILAVYLLLAYILLYINAYPALMKGYIPYSAFIIAIFVVITVILITIVPTILSSKTHKTLLREVT